MILMVWCDDGKNLKQNSGTIWRQAGRLSYASCVKISGFTFIRNGLALGYPFVPAIRSLLPLCDEIIVNVPRSTDGTLAAVQQIGDPKIRIIESEWDEAHAHRGPGDVAPYQSRAGPMHG